MPIFRNIYFVDKINNCYCRKFLEKFRLTTPNYWSMIASLLQLVALRPRVYYTLTNFFGGRGASKPPWPPLNTPMNTLEDSLSYGIFFQNYRKNFSLPHLTPYSISRRGQAPGPR